MKEIIIDSNIVFIATGQIGEAWAVVILEEAAKGRLRAISDVLYFQEILERYFYIKERYVGKKIFKSFKKIIENNVLNITVEDFDLSYKIYQEHKTRPRDNFHSAVAINNKKNNIFSIDGPDFSLIKDIKLISLDVLLQELNLKGNYIYERKNIFRHQHF